MSDQDTEDQALGDALNHLLVGRASQSTWPVRIMSAHGKPAQPSQFLRSCRTCAASFSGLAPGRTGERGLWSAGRWFCSVECAPPGEWPGLVLCDDQDGCSGRAVHCGCPAIQVGDDE